jgi:ferric-dicitrate binding protein FerR (iron transport regulator)
MSEEKQNDRDNESIGQLLRLAGMRPQAPPQREERVKTRVHEHWQSMIRVRRTGRAHRLFGVLAVAASITLMVLAGTWYLGSGDSGLPLARLEKSMGQVDLVAGDESGAIIRHTEVITGVDGRCALRLDNGASLRLDTGSRVRFEADDRLVLERGAAYLDTAGMAAQSAAVRIHTPLGPVRHLGTRYEVRLDEDQLWVRVREGAVSVGREGEARQVCAGSELRLATDGTVSHTALAAHGPHWDWVLELAPDFELEGASLEAFLGWVSRETGWRIAWDDASTLAAGREVILHGSLDGLRPDRAPEMVLPTCGLTATLQDGILLIAPDRS